MIPLRPDDEQRSAVAILEMDLRRRVQMEVREARLVEDLNGLGNGVPVICRRGVFGRERVHEPVRELFESQWHDAVPLRRMGQRRCCGLERREGQHEDALRRCGAHRHAGSSKATVEQQLHDEAAERVSDEDRRLLERLDLTPVVVDDLGQTEALELLRSLSQLLYVSVLAWPLGSGDGEPSVAEVVGEVLPAPCREPRSVHEHQGRAIRAGGFHGETSFSLTTDHATPATRRTKAGSI